MHRALSVLASPSAATPLRVASLALLLSLAPSLLAGQDPPVGQAGSVWNLGQLVAGKRYPTTVTAVNRDCKGKHDFQLEGDAGASFLKIEGDGLVKRLAPGQAKTLPAVVDLSTVAPGVYDRGHLVSRCLDCPPICRMDYQTINLRMTVVAPPDAVAAEPPTPATPGASPPQDPDRKTGVCGPDVSRALEQAMDRVQRRKAALPAGAVPDFSLSETPFRLIAEVVPFCPGPADVDCRDTVWLWGHCVGGMVPEWVLAGFVRALFGRTAILPSASGIPGSASEGDGFLFAYMTGLELAASLGTLDARVPRAFIGDAVTAATRRCRPCGGGGFPFSRDSSRDAWVLTDGSYVSYSE